ncbi:DUF4136 domain-containing protein [Hanstruepera neustonica]|uniref:DUF4136 domain-containing protein n=1 Tax=Hanstruepera neustonica TaxID=1445657 RepID=A0A2K1E4Z6_9FLAO|nr:DUF4136 domain-containing protein [Hanstruepera neustonica]PNQ75356.1 DUF4136 domain-containing protein [Hanstruepera neustonica]
MKKLFVLLAVLLMLSCGVTVNYDYQKETNFDQYKTYHYFDDMQTGLSELDAKRFFNSLDQALQAKGYVLSESPDFIIDIKSTSYQSAQSSSVGVGVGSGGGGVSVGIPVGQGNMSRQIIFDFVDGKTQQLIWQAVSSEPTLPENTPEAREAQFKVVIDKVLIGFPPKK